jgi:putative transposase
MLIAGERHLRIVLDRYVRHYNGHRPHQALGQQPPNPPLSRLRDHDARVERRPILGGLISEYAQAA